MTAYPVSAMIDVYHKLTIYGILTQIKKELLIKGDCNLLPLLCSNWYNRISNLLFDFIRFKEITLKTMFAYHL